MANPFPLARLLEEILYRIPFNREQLLGLCITSKYFPLSILTDLYADVELSRTEAGRLFNIAKTTAKHPALAHSVKFLTLYGSS